MHAAYIRIDSSQGCLAHTLARLPDTRKSASDLISPILARYDLKKKTFRMTVEPSYGREGGRFRMMDEPSYGRERVNMRHVEDFVKVEISLRYILFFASRF